VTGGGWSRRTSLRGLRRTLWSCQHFRRDAHGGAEVTVVDYYCCFAVAARIALGVDGLEALERRFADAPDLRGRWLGRVATRGQRHVCSRRGSHCAGMAGEEDEADEEDEGVGGVRTCRDVCVVLCRGWPWGWAARAFIETCYLAVALSFLTCGASPAVHAPSPKRQHSPRACWLQTRSQSRHRAWNMVYAG
jgi:hypothetical protein